MKDYLFVCPKCHGQRGRLLEEINQGEVDASEVEHLPEGLIGTSTIQCTNPVCYHEWQTVTHRQIVRSLALWNAPAPRMT